MNKTLIVMFLISGSYVCSMESPGSRADISAIVYRKKRERFDKEVADQRERIDKAAKENDEAAANRKTPRLEDLRNARLVPVFPDQTAFDAKNNQDAFCIGNCCKRTRLNLVAQPCSDCSKSSAGKALSREQVKNRCVAHSWGAQNKGLLGLSL